MIWVASLLGVVIIAVSIVWFGLLWRMYSLRHDFEIAARSPQLVILTGFSCYVMSTAVLLQWLLLNAGTSLPCWVVFVISYSIIGMGVIPFFIRMVRLVVAYNQAYRFKYARFVKWTPLVRVWAVAGTGLATRGVLFFESKPEHYSSNASQCFYFDDIFFMLGFMAVACVPAMMVARSLVQVFDAFRIRQEMERAIGICMIFASAMVLLQLLVFVGELPESYGVHVAVETLAFLFGFNVLIHSLLTPLVTHFKNNGWTKKVLVPVEEDLGIDDLPGVHELAKQGGEMAQRFGRFVQENLCMESWDFIVDAVQYEMQITRDQDEHYDAFLIILNQYLLPISPDEVNISSKMSKRMASFKTREAFVALNEEERLNILSEPLDEIVRVLEQNLLNKFQARIKLEIEAKKEASRVQAKGDSQLLALMRLSQGQKNKAPGRDYVTNLSNNSSNH
ncbi:unnamed protein product [Pylaiella littoralis]